jgi:chemotaxis protein MotB
MSRKAKHHEEEHENAERYLITYADLITLLLGLFIILYVSADQDTKKFKTMMAAAGDVFGTKSGGGSAGKGAGLGAGQGEGAGAGAGGHEPQPAPANSDKQLAIDAKEIASKIDGPGIKVTHDERGIVLLLKDSLFFDSGSASIKTPAYATLEKIAPAIGKLTYPVRVEGHADNVPIQTALYRSNWHLSAARALAAAEVLISRGNLPPARLQVVGFGDTRPVAANKTENDRRQNRRVEIVLLREEASGPAAKPEEPMSHGFPLYGPPSPIKPSAPDHAPQSHH